MRYLFLVLLLTGCTFAPDIGITEQEFRNQFRFSATDDLRFVGAQDNVRVFETNDVFYYFVDGRLDRVDQGQLYQQRIEVTVQ